MKFSVIIPFAHAEKTIRACLDSVIAAVDRLEADRPGVGAEVICVNGGCKDRAKSIVEESARKDTRILALTDWPSEAGAGAGPARNKGIDLAKGEYLVFVDADDMIEPEALVRIAKASADIVTFLPPEGVFDLMNAADRRATFSPMVGNLLVWNAIYRREMIGDWCFPNLSNEEDLVWTCGAYARAKTLVGSVKPWYHYDNHVSGSAVNSHSWKRVVAAWKATFLMWRAVKPCFAGNACVLRVVMARKMTMHLILHCFREIPIVFWRWLTAALLNWDFADEKN